MAFKHANEADGMSVIALQLRPGYIKVVVATVDENEGKTYFRS